MPPRLPIVLALGLLTACGGGAGGAGSNGPGRASNAVAVTNRGPVADAGAASSVAEGSHVTLDGSASRDPDGRITAYRWSQTSGSPVRLQQAGAIRATFTAPAVDAQSVLGFRLTVTDEQGIDATDYVRVTVRPARHTVAGTVVAAPATAADGDVNDTGAQQTSNDTPDAAQPIEIPVIVGGFGAAPGAAPAGPLQQSGDESDFFRVDLEAGQTAMLIVAEPERGDLDLYLWDTTGGIVDASIGAGTFETVTVAAAGRYLLEVAAPAGASNYGLVVGESRVPGTHSGLRLSADFVPGEIIVERQPARGIGVANARAADSRMRIVAGEPAQGPALARLDGRVHSLIARPLDASAHQHRIAAVQDPGVRAKLATLLAIKTLRLDPAVRYAQPNYRVHPQSAPDDPYYPLQWHYRLIDLPAAWTFGRGDSSVTVAVLDTGVLASHPDLAGQLLPGYDFVSSETGGGDGDGIDADPVDPGLGEGRAFHGTHVTGTVAALTDNGIGAAGVAPGVTILPVRVLGDRGGSSYDIIQGVRYAAGLANDSGTVADPVDVMNLSLGRRGPCWPAEQAAFDAAREAGVLVVAAAGNEAIEASGAFPASCANVVAVGAVGPDRALAPYSNFGTDVDVLAPGGLPGDYDDDGRSDGILSLGGHMSGELRYTYAFRHGTSMASPHVAGVLALMRSVNPTISPNAIDGLLAAGELTDAGGVIDATRAIFAALNGAGLPRDGHDGIVVTPATLDFGALYNHAEFEVRSAGRGPVQLTATTGWLDVSSVPDGDDGSRVVVRVDRSGMAPGTHTGVIGLTAGDAFAGVAVSMQVTRSSAAGDAGHVYVLLRDAATGEVVQQTEAAAGHGSYAYAFDAVAAGVYQIVAGTDADNDGMICDRGESCGIYPGPDGSSAFTVTGDISGADFSVGRLVSLAGTGADGTRAVARAAIDKQPAAQ